MIHNLSNNDRTKWDFFFEMNVIEFLNTVCFYVDKADVERAEFDKLKRHG